MKTFEFSIIASGLDPNAEDFADRFFEAGCDDATLSFQKGHIIIDFAREADAIDDAIISAIENVRAAGATVERVEPDPLVNLSEIAARSGLSRAAVSLYAKGARGVGFPAPVARVTTESPLWDWAIVSHWLVENHKLSAETAVAAVAFKTANNALSMGSADIRSQLKRCVDDEYYAACAVA